MKQIRVDINRIKAWEVWTLNVPDSFPSAATEVEQIKWLEANPTLIEWVLQENVGDNGMEFTGVMEKGFRIRGTRYDLTPEFRAARSLCDGADVKGEYVRGIAELLIDSNSGIDMDDKDVLIEWLIDGRVE